MPGWEVTGPDGIMKGGCQCRMWPGRTWQDLDWSVPTTGHERKGSVGRRRSRQDKVGPGWAGHGREWQDRTWPDRSGRIAPGMVGQGRVEKDRAGLRSVGQCWTGLGKIWQDLAWSTEPDRGGKGSVRQCKTRQIQAELVWVRIDHVIVGLDQVGR